METEIDFVLDNAGGHGTDEAKFLYMESLKTNFNINIVWQVPQSPDTNLLDLGVWCALQSAIELCHRTKTKSNQDALARSMEKAWEDMPQAIFEAVACRWAKVLQIICHTRGDNVKSDAFRGKATVPTFELADLEAELADEDDTENQVIEDPNVGDDSIDD